MAIEALIAQYGYIALLVGTFAEGETVLALAGYAAHRGYLDLIWVVVVAWAGGFLGDQLYFWLGRRHAPWVFRRIPSLGHRVLRVEDYLRRFEAWVIVGIRFMYGLRIAGPIVIGMSRVSGLKFVTLNFLGAGLWSVLFSGGGYLLGARMGPLIEAGGAVGEWLLVALLGAGAVVLLIRRASRRSRSDQS